MGDYVFESDESEEETSSTPRLKYKAVSDHSCEEEALTALHCVDTSEYMHLRAYGPDRKHISLHRCVLHASCSRRLRIVRIAEFAPSGGIETTTYSVEEGGEHVGEETNRKRSGIDMQMKSEVDSILKGGAGPKRCRLLLFTKYAKNADKLARIPTAIQLKNRKASLKNGRKKHWDVSNFSVMMEWASSRMCTTPERFFGEAEFDSESDKVTFSQQSLEYQNELLILGTFDHEFDGDAGRATSFGLIFTSRKIFRNLYYTVQSQHGDGVVGLTDGTYKIDFNGWTLVCFGTAIGVYDRRQYRHSFVPWMYMFVRTEHKFAYLTMFTTAVEKAASFFGVTLSLAYGSQDHADYIASAFTSTWPNIRILNCYPHLSRKAFEKVGLLNDADFYKTHLDQNIHDLELARSPTQFEALAARCTKFWSLKNEKEYAQWFSTQYLGDPWGTWFATAAVPGVMPSQNPIESHHKVLKRVCFPSLRAATSVVLNETLPAVLYLDCDKNLSGFSHYAEGPIVSEMVEHARVFIQKPNHLKQTTSEREGSIDSIVSNTWEYAVHGRNSTGVEVTRTRAARYIDSKNGNLRKGSRVPDFQLYYLSLHEVKFLQADQTSSFCLPLSPVVTSEQICEIRSRYECDCKGFWKSGWICSHVVATLSIMNQYDLKTATANLPVRKKSGGQRKPRNCLSREDNRFFAKPKLERDLVKKPSMPIGWNVTMLLECTGDDGAVSMRNVPGRIMDWQDCVGSTGVFKWSVRFQNGQEKFFEVDQLADLISRSDMDGLNVTGRLFDADVTSSAYPGAAS